MPTRIITLGYPNRTDEGVLSGGSWQSTLPITNMQDRVIAHVARTSTAALADTKFDLDLGQARFIGALALAGYNLMVGSKVKITGATSQGNLTSSPSYTSGWIDVWPLGAIPQDMLEWEDDNFWLGTISAEARAAYNTPFIHTFDRTSLRWWRVEIDDTANPDGYIQIGRLIISDVWTPTYNMSYGTGLAVEDTSNVEESESGVDYFDQGSKYRTFAANLELMTEDEAYSRMLEIQRQLGTRGEILVIPDPGDSTNGFRRNMLARLSKISPIMHTNYNMFSIQLEFKELL